MIHLLKILSEMMRGKPIRSGRLYLRPPHRRDVKGWLAVRAASRAFLVPWEPTWPRDALTRKAFLRRLRAHAIHSETIIVQLTRKLNEQGTIINRQSWWKFWDQSDDN